MILILILIIIFITKFRHKLTKNLGIETAMCWFNIVTKNKKSKKKIKIDLANKPELQLPCYVQLFDYSIKFSYF
jgi:hypothetical protein